MTPAEINFVKDVRRIAPDAQVTMSQTKIDSILESATNIAVGAGVALAAQLFLFPLYGIHIPLSTDLWLTLWFTIISFVRSYLLRRFFNARRFWKGKT